MVSEHSEGTFERLRHPFGRERPSQSPPPDIVTSRITLHVKIHTARLNPRRFPPTASMSLVSTYPCTAYRSQIKSK
ncbi:hypothetical protein EUBVEN_00039 [Eubacterium ventriosum ATCC 27560]|uniref:Uncharacterized protein n=1 Tax=Eubacterium ventriosum ATCC 27560 TaxID=411463 RepID=A5Z307_9FIRM|nr:hypothetical protein EUBVEN_00039 [Eubacterium ventriosum ATCC 27560]